MLSSNSPIPHVQLYENLEKSLGRQRRIDYITPDGNCLFCSLSKEILGHQKFHYLIRQMTIEFMKENEEIFNAYIFGESVKDHWNILVSGEPRQKFLPLQHC